MSTAKGLCYALEIPLLVVPTFEAVARAVFEKHNSIHEVAILSDAKQGEYYLQRFKRTSGEPIPAGKARIVGRDEAMEGIPAHTSILFVIDRREIRRQIAEKGGACASLAEFMSGVPVAHLGLKKYLAKEFADVASAEPFYLKDFVVTSPARSHKVAG
jgi:tRNA threonylcarbamoyladenosine biosynthesis protein TsaB